jgi:hypothetical protein
MEALATIPCLEEQIQLPDKNIALISATNGWGINKLLHQIAAFLTKI